MRSLERHPDDANDHRRQPRIYKNAQINMRKSSAVLACRRKVTSHPRASYNAT